MSEKEKINSGDNLFGVGIVVTDYLMDELFQDKDDIIITPLEEDEEIEYDGKLEEIRVISENEEFSLVCVKYYIPFSQKDGKNYFIFDNEEFVLLKEINLEEEAPGIDSSKKIGETFKRISDYLELPVKELCFFFYFPEKIMIDRGEPYVSIEYQNEWEQEEKFGEHEDE